MLGIKVKDYKITSQSNTKKLISSEMRMSNLKRKMKI